MSNSNIRKFQGQRLAAARALAGYKSARAAALENEWPESTYRSHEAGTRTIGQDDADRYAKRFRAAGVSVTGQSILYGPAPGRADDARRRDLVQIYDSLPPHLQDSLADIAKTLADSFQQQESPKLLPPAKSKSKT